MRREGTITITSTSTIKKRITRTITSTSRMGREVKFGGEACRDLDQEIGLVGMFHAAYPHSSKHLAQSLEMRFFHAAGIFPNWFFR